jgi:hypothetical protein
VRARGSGVRRLCHGQEPAAAAGPRPERNRAEERQCCVVRAYQVKRLVCLWSVRRRPCPRHSGQSSRAFLSKRGSQSAIKQIRKKNPGRKILTKKATEGEQSV